MRRIWFGATLGVMLLGPAAIAKAAPPSTPPASFRTCMVCHKTVAGQKGIGPTLFKVTGRRAGSLDGFNFSPAMKTYGKPWTRAELDKFLANPRAVVPGTKMAFAGQRDPKLRAEILTYLAALK